MCLADLLTRRATRKAPPATWPSRTSGRPRWRQWTVTSTGPLSADPYYLRLTKDGNPNAGTTYNLGDNNVGEVDQRTVVDPSFLELVRLGLRPADDPTILNTIAVVDARTGRPDAGRPALAPLHERRLRRTGRRRPVERDLADADHATYGRLWPIFAGERGEYELLAGDPSRGPGPPDAPSPPRPTAA